MKQKGRQFPGEKGKKPCRFPGKNSEKTIETDPLGSYTGNSSVTPQPTQDADDL